MTRLLFPHEREAIAKQIKDAINEYCRVTYDDGHRNHLGASLIGDPCARRLWYIFRWVKRPDFINAKGENHAGRMQRLFKRGHLEEARWIEWLRGIGFTIWDLDENGEQVRITGASGHFGGSLDSVGKAPGWLKLLAEVGPVLVEYKTYSRKQFDKLLKDGVKKTKPLHFAQMSKYGAHYGFRYALYCPICKDDDDIAPEIVELDWSLSTDLDRKAEEIILSQTPPPRYSELPSHLECKFCDFLTVCHNGAAYEKNCRSCQFARPIKDGQWWCEQHGDIIPKDFIPKGCPAWKPVGRS